MDALVLDTATTTIVIALRQRHVQRTSLFGAAAVAPLPLAVTGRTLLAPPPAARLGTVVHCYHD